MCEHADKAAKQADSLLRHLIEFSTMLKLFRDEVESQEEQEFKVKNAGTTNLATR